MHKNAFFHRDLKPENLLISSETDVIKIADFGLAREIRSMPPFTDYVSTRWYRAPEIILKSATYNSPVDIFALGCIMAELYMLAPLFNGQNELDQLKKITKVLGAPPQSWKEGYQLAGQLRFNFPDFPKIPLKNIIPTASSEALNLMEQMLQYESSKRPTAQQILAHPYFSVYRPSSRNLGGSQKIARNTPQLPVDPNKSHIITTSANILNTQYSQKYHSELTNNMNKADNNIVLNNNLSHSNLLNQQMPQPQKPGSLAHQGSNT